MGRHGKRKWRTHTASPERAADHRRMAASSTDTDPTIQTEMDYLFKKQFSYPCGQQEDWLVPDSLGSVEQPHWQDEQLTQLRTELNSVKNQLSGFDISEWHSHTQRTHRAGKVLSWVRQSAQPELCTQAWCKFWEVLALLHPLPASHSDCLNTVHICEAPGAFITALNHFLITRGHGSQWQWMANSLNPYYEGNMLREMIDDDRFIFDTLDNWCFGLDNTGDMISRDNIQHLCTTVKQRMGSVHLFSADGSIDCANSPGEQEVLLAPLHLCELVTGLLLLQQGGHLVLKLFTMFEDTSVCLVYLLCCTFQQVHIVKPVCSKPGNSEVYLVAKHFKGLAQHLTTQLINLTGSSSRGQPLFNRTLIPDSFLRCHRQCCHLVTQWQIQTIQENLTTFGNMDPHADQHLQAARDHCTREFVRRYPLGQIHKTQTILHQFHEARKLHKTVKPKRYRRHQGSFNDRQEMSRLPWQQRIRHMTSHEDGRPCADLWLQEQFDLCESEVLSWQSVTGRPVTRVHTSRFCCSELLNQYNDFMDHSTCMAVSHDQYDLALSDLGTIVAQRIASLHRSSPAHVTLPLHAHSLDSDSQTFTAAISKALGHEAGEACTSGSPGLYCLSTYTPQLSDQQWSVTAGNWTRLHPVLQKLSAGDSLVLASPAVLTRLNAALVFLLHCCFCQVSVVTDGSGRVALCALVAVGYSPRDSEAVLRYVGSVVQQLTPAADGCASSSTVSVVPIQLLHEARFYNMIESANNDLLQRRINYLLDKEMALLSKSSTNEATQCEGGVGGHTEACTSEATQCEGGPGGHSV